MDLLTVLAMFSEARCNKVPVRAALQHRYCKYLLDITCMAVINKIVMLLSREKKYGTTIIKLHQDTHNSRGR